jgi:hypothetical protein
MAIQGNLIHFSPVWDLPTGASIDPIRLWFHVLWYIYGLFSAYLLFFFLFEGQPRPLKWMVIGGKLTGCAPGWALSIGTYLNWAYKTLIFWDIAHLMVLCDIDMEVFIDFFPIFLLLSGVKSRKKLRFDSYFLCYGPSKVEKIADYCNWKIQVTKGQKS